MRIFFPCINENYEGWYETNVSYFFIRNYKYSYIKIYIFHGYILYKVDISFPQSLHHYQHAFPPLYKLLHASSIDLFCWSIGVLDAHCVSACRLPQNGILEVHLSRGQKDESWITLNLLLPTMTQESRLPDMLVLMTVALGSERYICGFWVTVFLYLKNMLLFFLHCNFISFLFPP